MSSLISASVCFVRWPNSNCPSCGWSRPTRQHILPLVVKDFIARISLMHTSAAEARASTGRQGCCVCLWLRQHKVRGLAAPGCSQTMTETVVFYPNNTGSWLEVTPPPAMDILGGIG
jgi:hypothetical protein